MSFLPPAVAVEKPAPTVLLVDDDSSVRTSLGRVLLAEGLQLMTARGVKDALEHISRHAPDLVITDLCMAPLSGCDLITHLANKFPALPVFVITALPLQSAGGVERLAAGFFQKPLNLEAVFAAIRRALGVVGPAPRASIARQ